VTTNVGTSLETFTSGEPTGVDVPSIERELASLWRQSAESGDKAVSRACLWNLVIHAEGDAAYQNAQKIAQAIAPACPARFLLLDLEPPEEGRRELEAWISANCHLAPGGGKLLCSEEITLLARGRGAEHLPSLVSALLVPDVPTAVYWTGPRPSDALKWRRLVEAGERLIVDTGRLVSASELVGLSSVARLSFDVELADLGWLRLAPFRVLLASLFDPPIGAEPLRRCTRVRLDCAREGAATAALLVGWLASRLDWGPPRRSGQGWTIPRAGGELRLDIDLRDVDAGADGIYAFEVAGDKGESYSITDAGPQVVEARGTGLPTRLLSAPERPPAELLVAALGMRGHDPLFGAALARAAELETAR
jgi:hypothetical protein